MLVHAAVLAVLMRCMLAVGPGSRMAVLRFNGGMMLEAMMDPIISPGGKSGHVHLIQGGNAFAYTMDVQTPFQSTCTSADITLDKSNYWVPKLYFHDPATGKFEDVKLNYMNAYYFYDEDTKPFPPGLRMISGDPFKRTPPASGAMVFDKGGGKTIQPVQITCPRANDATPLYPTGNDGINPPVGLADPMNKGAGAGFSDKECDGQYSPMRMDLYFPNCYLEGHDVNDWKAMEYTTDGQCPTGYRKVPRLFYEVYWSTMDFHGRWTPGQNKSPWVLAQGDPTGYGMHGDFISGWDEAALQWIISNCDRSPKNGVFVDNGMKQCVGVPGGINNANCKIPDPAGDVLTGVMDKLPGNNPLGQWGVNDPRGSGGAPVEHSSTTAPAASSTSSTLTTGSNVPPNPSQSSSSTKITSSSGRPIPSQSSSTTTMTSSGSGGSPDDSTITTTITLTDTTTLSSGPGSGSSTSGTSDQSVPPGGSSSTRTTTLSVPFFTYQPTTTITSLTTDSSLPCSCAPGESNSANPNMVVITEMATAWVTETTYITITTDAAAVSAASVAPANTMVTTTSTANAGAMGMPAAGQSSSTSTTSSNAAAKHKRHELAIFTHLTDHVHARHGYGGRPYGHPRHVHLDARAPFSTTS